MFGFVRGVRGRAVVVVLVVAGLLGGVTASSVAAATKTTVTWKVSSLTAGQEKNLSAVASTNSKGVKTWSKTGSCTLSPKSNPPKLTMGAGSSCTLTLKIAKTSKYPAKTSDQTITRKSPTTTTTTLAPPTTTTTTTLAPTTTTTTLAPPTTTTTTTLAPPTTTTTTTLAPVLYNVGDTGPGGGIIFYVDLTRAAGSRYFEAAPVGVEVLRTWATGANQFAAVTGADGTAIGSGGQNTADIVLQSGNVAATPAAAYCSDLVSGGKSDWFLPSKDELNQMYTNLDSASTPLGGFSTGYYWSSSEVDGPHAWAQGFDLGDQGYGTKGDTHYVRPVRAF